MRGKRDRGRVPNWLVGLAVLLVVAAASLLAFTKQVPWHSGYEIHAVFGSAQNVRADSPVRIAGIDVGKVTSVEPLTAASTEELRADAGGSAPLGSDQAPGQDAAVVTMEINDEGRPIHSDATMKLRPRLFLEGNYFVDLEPGSPNAEEVDSGFTVPINQTRYSVQLDQVLTTLQGDVRTDLQTFLDQFGNALTKYGGAEGFRELYRSSPDSFKYTSQVNESLLGTQPGDLQGLIHGLDQVVRGLDRNQSALQGLVSNLATFSGSFAAQDRALGEAIQVLPDVFEASRPAFANLNAAFPPVRAFAREALPGVRSTPATLDASIPFVHQLRELVAPDELRGLVADLRPTIPRLAELADRSVNFFDTTRELASCFNEVVIPWSEDTVKPVDPTNQYAHDPVGRVFEETAYGLNGISSESRSGDANGQYIRVEAGGGTNTVVVPDALPTPAGTLQDAVGVTAFPILGAMPRIEDSAKTQFRPDVRCETQQPPNLEGGLGAGPQQSPAPTASPTDLLDQVPVNQLRSAGRTLGLGADAARSLAQLGGGG